MAWPNIVQADYLLLTYEYTLASQRMLSTFGYRISTLTGGTVPFDSFATAWANDADFVSLRDAIIDVLPSNVTIERYGIQRIGANRLAKYYANADLDGTNVAATATNVAGVITRRSFAGTRVGVGSVHFPIPSDDTNIVDGQLTAGLIAKLDAVAAWGPSLMSIALGGGVNAVLSPVTFGKDQAGTLFTSPIDQALTQETARVMRRRTVGLGI